MPLKHTVQKNSLSSLGLPATFERNTLNSFGTKTSNAPKPQYSVNSEVPQKEIPYTEYEEVIETIDFLAEDSPMLVALVNLQSENSKAEETEWQVTCEPQTLKGSIDATTPLKKESVVSFIRLEAAMSQTRC